MKQERINYLIEKAYEHQLFLLTYKQSQAQAITANSPISIPYLSVIIDFYDRFITTMQTPKIQTYLINLFDLDRGNTSELYQRIKKPSIWKTEASFDSLNEFLEEALEIVQFSAVLCHHFYEATKDKSKKNRINNQNLIINLLLAQIACGITLMALGTLSIFIASPYLISAIGIFMAITGILLITIAHLRDKQLLPNDEDIFFEIMPLKEFEKIESRYPKMELESDTGDLVASSNSSYIDTSHIYINDKKYVDAHEARTCFFQHGAKLQEDESVRSSRMAS
jgi:hypothetical protein